MELEIKNKSYQMRFGLAFLRYMDEKHNIKQNGVTLGFGVFTALIQIEQGNPLILVDLIKAATITESKQPAMKDIETFIEEHEDIEQLMTDFLTMLEKSSITKNQVKKAQQMSSQTASV